MPGISGAGPLGRTVRLLMFCGPRKPLTEMTNREIISSIVAFAVIGGFIIIACIVSAMRSSGSVVLVVWNAIGMLFVATILACSVPQAVAELRRRRGKH